MQQINVDRREFAHRLAAGALAALPLAASDSAPACAAEPPEDGAKTSPAALYLELVKQQYPRGLNDEHLAAIRKDIDAFLVRSRLLSAFPLVNSDEPATELAAYRQHET